MSEQWTLDAVKEHFEALRVDDKEAVATALAAQEKAVAAALVAAEKAVLKAENAAEKRFEASNEIRGAMMDAQKNFPNLAQFEALKEQVTRLELAVSGNAKKSEGFGQLGLILGLLVGAAGTLFAIFGNGG